MAHAPRVLDAPLVRSRIHAAWLGKAIGGTIGMPDEGLPGPLTIPPARWTPRGAVANDDLDLQLLWLVALERDGWGDPLGTLARAWVEHQAFEVDEYAVALSNLRRGIQPPMSGLHNNPYVNGMGAAIRSEIWACLFPGQPELAAGMAHLDACVDHAGEGIESEKFVAVMQSLAFVISDVNQAIGEALTYIDPRSKLHDVVAVLREATKAGRSAEQARRELFDRFGHHNFTDCVMNLSFVLYGLYFGQGDFRQTLELTLSCGQDTDCTAATAAATLGIFRGPDVLPGEWVQAVQGSIVASDHLLSLPLPKDLHELTDRTVALRQRWVAAGSPQPRIPADAATLPAVDDGHSYRLTLTDGAEGLKLPEVGQGRVVKGRALGLAVGRYLGQRDANAYVLTTFAPSEAVDGWLTICGQAGLTAWLDDEVILNYHGRRKPIPAAHRTEGGASVPVRLAAGQRHRLLVRLLGPRADADLFISVSRKNGALLGDLRFEAP